MRTDLNSKKLIVVLGMHRSGTSALTRGLQVFNIDLGNNLMPAVEGDNSTGYWEDLDINNLNVEMLNFLGKDWYSLASIRAEEVDALEKSGYIEKASEILINKLSSYETFAFKDPRVTKLLPFWQHVFTQLRIEPNYVISIRHPLSVTTSLQRRKGFEIEQCLLLWLDHVIQSLIYTSSEKRILVDYDHLLENPKHDLERLSQFLNLAINERKLREFESDFLDKKLRHSRNEQTDTISDDISFLLPLQIYDELLKVAITSDPAVASALKIQIEKWQADFQKQQMALILSDKLTGLKEKLTGLNEKLSYKLEQENISLNKLKSEYVSLEHETQILSSQLSEIHESKAWKLAQFFQKVRLKLVPVGSSREKIISFSMRLFSYFYTIRKPFIRSSAISDPSQEISFLEVAQPENVSSYVSYNSQQPDLSASDIKLIAFYLPQFHPIPENDLWWGKGFTEWTNVTKAKPNFVGHYQPHQPYDLGYYDLRVLDTQKRQVELAKHYGIYGFCFYYYWFGGKRLLELPLKQYLDNSEIDFPFCLCWANENWTRRWDGSEHEILIAQKYSKDQYTHFIRDIMPHFRDSRYIRIDGKPMLLVYRVDVLPDSQQAVEIWRAECRLAGIGEIYLVAVQSFGITDPRPYGFDAAVEFPPHHLKEVALKHKKVRLVNKDFKGQLFDYNLAAQVMLGKKHPDYPVFKTIMPSWDNTARRQNNSHIFVYATPDNYKSWLSQAIEKTKLRNPKDKRFVFINAWNEWGEGTHLEPDQKYGYAYLQATSDALHEALLTGPMSPPKPDGPSSPIRQTQNNTAVILHLYYPKLWNEIKNYLQNLGETFDLFVTIPESVDIGEKEIVTAFPNAKIIYFSNRGRDIAPFINVFQNHIYPSQYDFALKIHTKRTLHRQDGHVWRKDLLDKIIGSHHLVNEIKNIFTTQTDVGIIAPQGHVLPISTYWGANKSHVSKLAELAKIDFASDDMFTFAAGSMFWFRPETFARLAKLTVSQNDFEIENSQIDGTLAHAFERFFGLLSLKSGYKIIEINKDGSVEKPLDPDKFSYPFAEKSRS